MTPRTIAVLALSCATLGCAELLLTPAAASAEPSEIRFLDAKSGCRLVHPGTRTLVDGVIQVRRRAYLDRSRNIEGFPGSDAWIFSVVDSDVDLLVDFDRSRNLSLVDYAEIRLRLCDLLGRDVDLVQRSRLKPFLRDAILSEARVVL